MRLGYANVYRYPGGFHDWRDSHPEAAEGDGASKTLAVGDLFPECRLAVLSGKRDREYLGLPEGARWFSLADLGAPLALIQIYNTQCTSCAAETRKLSAFSLSVDQEPALSGKLRFIGIGVYDTNRDVLRFRKKYDVQYPLFSDTRGEIFSCLGQAELPLVYLVQATGDGSWRIELIKRGYFEPDETFMNILKGVAARVEGVD